MEHPLLQDTHTELNDLSGSDIETAPNDDDDDGDYYYYWRIRSLSPGSRRRGRRSYRSSRFRTCTKRRYSTWQFVLFASLAVLVAFLVLLGVYDLLQGSHISEMIFPSLFLHRTNNNAEEKAVFDASGNLIRHPHYVVFEPPSHLKQPQQQNQHHHQHHSSDLPLRSVRRLPDSCLDALFAHGEPCYDNTPSTFDLVWTWVNASDWRLQQEMRKTLQQLHLPTSDKQAGESNSKLYRDHDELRHSLRSVLRHFRPFIRKFHIFTSDFPFSQDSYTLRVTNATGTTEGREEEANSTHSPPQQQVIDIPNNASIRLGQLPSWLRSQDEGRWRDGDVQLQITYQSQVFQNFMETSFNSFGIETQLPHLKDIEYNVIYLNDDFYFTADLIPADFYTSAYGTVLRFDIGFLIDPERLAEGDPAGEWGPLKYTSWLLSERFGYRGRPYAKHAAKSLPIALLDEAGRIWEKEFGQTARHLFRGMRGDGSAGAGEDDDGGDDEEEGGDGAGVWDVHATFLLPHLIVERWREALIWSWVVGRIGGVNDEWGEVEKRRAWAEVTGGGVGAEDVEKEKEVRVRLGPRKTLEEERVESVLRQSGEGVSKRTQYEFASLDGYPYGFVDSEGQTTLPVFSADDHDNSDSDNSDDDERERVVCTLDFDECFNSASSASDAFKNIAFDKVHCGDCVIHALREKSGALGLSAFLPAPDRTYVPPDNTLWSEWLDFDMDNNNENDNNDGGSGPGGAGAGAGAGNDDEDVEEMEIEDEPHLPLDNNWRTAKFALKDVLDAYGSGGGGGSGGGVGVRRWIERVLERYRFIIGNSNVVFLMIEGPDEARNALGGLSSDVSLLCMNDDVKEGFWETDRILRDWQERRWSTPAQWEWS